MNSNIKTDIVEETTAIKAAAEVAQKYRILCRAVIALAFGFFVMAGCCIWAVVNAQTIANDAVLQALKTVGEMEVSHEETTTQSVEGDSAIINNAEFEQYNDNAQNGGGN